MHQLRPATSLRLPFAQHSFNVLLHPPQGFPEHLLSYRYRFVVLEGREAECFGRRALLQLHVLSGYADLNGKCVAKHGYKVAAIHASPEIGRVLHRHVDGGPYGFLSVRTYAKGLT